MRADRDQPDRDRIELIEVDADLFGGDQRPAVRQASRRTALLKAVAPMAAVAVAAAIWWPRSEAPEWQVFQPAVLPAVGLTEELVFDDPPGALVSVDIAPRPVDVKPELGYVFAEPGGTILTRRWASFRTQTTNLPDAPAAADVVTVRGVPADVRRIRMRHFVEWGPLDGRSWTATTNLLSEAESIEFADHVAIIEGRPALANRYDLGAMRPIGSVAALDSVVTLTSLLSGDRLLSPVMPTMLTWASGAASVPGTTTEAALTLGSIAAPADALPLVEFMLGDGRPVTVHGLPAVIIESKAFGPVVAWLEDGRLVVVVGDLADEELISLAESVRPATSGEWRVVRRVDLRNSPTEP